MEPKVIQNYFKLFLFIITFIEITKSVPLSWQSNSCASSCTPDPFMVRYDSGNTYYYSFETSSHLSIEDNDDYDQPLVINGQMALSSYGSCELGLQLTDVNINGVSNQQKFIIKEALEANPIMFGLDDGRVVGVCPSIDDQQYIIDIKKSLIGSLQMTARSPNDKTVVMETDILGDCETEYIPTYKYSSLPRASIYMQKKKTLNNCSKRQQSVIGLFPRAFGVNEVLSRQTAPLMNATLTCQQILDYDIITSVTCHETQAPSLWLRQQATPNVVSSLKIKFVRQASGLSARRLASDSISRHVLKMSEPKGKNINWYSKKYEESDVIALFRDMCAQFEPAQARKGGRALQIQSYFPEIVQSLQQINDVNVFKRLDQSVHDKQYCSENDQVLHDLWLDALAVSATEPGLQILVQSVNNNEISNLKSSYLFSLLAFSSEPNVGAVRSLLPLLENSQSQRQVVLGISSLIRNLREKEPLVSDDVLNRATEALVARVQSQARAAVPIDAIASIKALENVLDRYSAQSRAQSVLVELAQDSGLDSGVRSAAISALSHFKVDASVWNDVIERVILDTRAPLELRINGYKSSLNSGLNSNQLKKILDFITNNNENEKQFSNFVKTHQKSIRESSDPFKRDLLPRDAPLFPNPEFNSIFDFGKSRNIEFSYLNNKLSSGFVIESDLIYSENSKIPKSISFNSSVPFFGKQLQIIEITFRQNGFDDVIENAFKINSNENYFKIFSEIIESFNSNSEQNNENNNNNNNENNNNGNGNQNQNQNSFKKLKLIQNLNQRFAQIFIKFDGKSILVFDLINDFEKFDQIFKQFKEQLRERQVFERAFALVLSDTRVRIPTLTGIPLEFNVNASVAAAINSDVLYTGLKTEVRLRPSVTGQLSVGIGLSVPSAQRGLVFVGGAWSAPVIDFKVNTENQKLFNLKVNIPNKQSLFGFSFKQCPIPGVPKPKPMDKNTELQHMRICTDGSNPKVYIYTYGNNSDDIPPFLKQLSKTLGMKLCLEYLYPKPLLNTLRNIEFDLTLEKADKKLQFYEFEIEVPRGTHHQELSVWRVAFNTPNSEVNREMSAELSLIRPPQGKQELKFELKTPFKNIRTSIGFRNEQKERSIQIELIHENRQLFSIDFGLTQQTRGQKREYKPRLKIEVEGNQPIVLQGSVSVSRGRKNAIQISLEGPEAGKQFLKGQFVREGERRSNDWRVSSDVALQVPEMVELRVAGVVDKALKHVSTDLTFEYKFGKQMERKEQIKISMKAQNLTQTSLTKMSALGDMTSSQFPNINTQIAYNLLEKPNEHFENELTITWSQHLQKKFRLLQVMKVLSENKIENTLNIEITPLKVDYEMRANVEKANQKPLKYSLEVIGKDKKGNKANDVRANVEYKHVSESPLHVSLEMNAKSGFGYDVSYSDDLKEIARGEFKGRTSVRWDKDKSAALDYVYKTKSEPRSGVIHHELETELMTPHKSPFPIKHSGLLRMTRDGFEVKSRAHANGRQLYAVEGVGSYSNPQQNSRFALDVTNMGRGRLEFNPYSVPRVASLDVVLPNYSDFEHKSNFEYEPRASFSLNSQTKRAQQNLFALDSHFARENPSRVVITSQPLDARVNYHPITRTLEVNAKSPENDWSHVSTVIANPVSRVMSLKSTTTQRSNPLVDIESEFAPKHKSYLNVNVARVGALAFDANLAQRAQRNANLVIKSVSGAEHNSKLLWGKSGTKFVSTSMDRKRTPLLSIDYNHDSDDARHTLSVDTNAIESRLDAQLSPYADDNAVKFALKSGARAPHRFSHETELKVNSNAIQIASKTQNRNQNIATIDATLARQYTSQPSNVRLNVLNTRSQLAWNPREGAKFEYNNPSLIDHVTQLDYQPNESSYSLVSRSRTPNSNVYNLNGFYSRDSQSLETQIPSFDASLRFVPQSNSAKFEFRGKRANNAYNHVTELELNPQQYTMTSRTDRQDNGQNVLSLDGLLSNKKSIALKYLDGKRATEGKIQIVNNNDNDGNNVNVFGRHQQYTHSSDFDWNRNALKIKSRTDFEPNQQNLNKIDALIPMNPYLSGSHVTVVSPQIYSSLSHSPNDRNGKFELRTQGFEHQTSLAHNSREQQYQLKSLTINALNKQKLFELNSLVNPKHVNIALVSPNNLNSKLILQNSNGAKNAEFELNAHRIPRVLSGLVSSQFAHKTDLSLNPLNAFELNSQTSVDARVFANLNAKLNQPNNALSLETPHFVARTQYQNIGSPRVELEFRSKNSRGRHVLASIEGGVGNGVEVDVAWDKALDPNNRMVLTLNVERNRNGNSFTDLSRVSTDLVSMTINYKQNELKLFSEMNSQSLISGPHTLTLSWKPQSGDVVQLTANHNWNFRDRQLTCQTSYSVGGVLQFSSKFEAKATPNNVYSAHVITSSPNDNAFDYDFGVEARVVNDNEVNANIWANNGASRTANAKLQMTRDSYQGIYNGDLTLQVNGVDWRRVSFNVNRNERLIEADVYAANTKQLALMARASDNAISFNLLSNVARVPSLKALGSLDVNKRSIVITIEKNEIRVFDLSAKMTGNYYYNDLNADFRIICPLFAVSANAKRLSGHVSAGTELLVNDRTVFSAQFSAQNQRNLANNWIAKGHIVVNEAELARVSLEQSFGSNALQYALRASSQYAREFSPLNVLIAKKAQSRDREYSIEVCAKGDASQCMRAQIDIQLSDTRYHNNIQQIVMKVSKPGTDVQFEYALNSEQKLNDGSRYERSLLDARAGQTYRTYGARRSALVLTVNAHALGAELLIPERSRQGVDGSLKLSFPSARVITTRADISYTNDGYVMKADIKNVNDVILSLNADVTQRNELNARFELNSPKFNRNPKVLSFVWKQYTRERPFDIRFEADVSSEQNNALVIESFSTFNSYTNNRTINLIINSRDKRIDFSCVGHMAFGQSAGIQWNNINRNGFQSNGYYFAQKDIQNAFNLIINDHYRIRAQISDNYLESTWTVFDMRRNVEDGQLRVQFADTCALFEVSRDSLTPASSLRVCLADKERHLLVITTEVKQNANSIIKSKLELDSRSQQKTLRFALDWSPQSVAGVLKDIVNRNDWSPLTSRVIDSEICREIGHKTERIFNVISRDIIYPLMTVLSDEFEDILQELSQHFPSIRSLIEQISNNYQQFVNQFNDILNDVYDVIYGLVRQLTPTVVSDALKQWSRVATRALRNTCIRNSNTCYQYVYAFERYGFEGILQLSFQKVYESARQTHRFAMTTLGRVSTTWNDLKQMKFYPSLDYVLDTRIGQIISDYARAIVFRVYDSLNGLFERIIESNDDLRQLLNAFNRIIIELSKQFESIEWTRVTNALNDAIKAILTPESSSTRVLLWDPHNGRIMLEVRAPVIRRQLRAIMTPDTSAQSLFDSVQSWLSDTFKQKMEQKDKKSTKKIYE